MISSSSSDFKILIITSSKEKLPGPVNAIEVAEAKYKSKSSSKKILKPEVTSLSEATIKIRLEKRNSYRKRLALINSLYPKKLA